MDMSTTTSTPFTLRLASASGLFGRGEYLEASRALAELVAEAELTDPGHRITDLRLLLARAYYHSAQLGRAEQVLHTVLEEDPTDGYAHLLLGRTLQRAARHDEAKRSLALAEVFGDYERPTAHAAPRAASEQPTDSVA
jgi:Flp pilus assembly protein TadD